MFGRRALIFGLGALLLGAAIASLAVWNLKPSPPQRVTRTVINLPPGQQLPVFERGPVVALSPDGANLAYVAIQGDMQQLYLRAMDSLEARPMSWYGRSGRTVFLPRRAVAGVFRGWKAEENLSERRGGADAKRCGAASRR